MARAISPEREKEYQELHAFLGFYATNVMGIAATDPVHPSNVGEQIAQKFGKSKALDGLRQAVNDVIENLNGSSSGVVAALDQALRANGLTTASEIRRRYAASYKRILKRGHFASETEYYLINGIVCDSGGRASDEELSQLQGLLSAYEAGA